MDFKPICNSFCLKLTDRCPSKKVHPRCKEKIEAIFPPPMPRYTRWLRQLLAVSDGDPGLARRQLAWLMGKVHSDTQRLSERRVLLDRYVRDCVHRHKPIQYILGTQPFGDLDIVTKPPTLIPRYIN